jgi:hypothetical protein
MKETKLPQSMREVVSRNNGLKRYLSGLSEGRDATPRSSLYNLPGKTQLLEPDEILARWKEQLSVLESGDSYEKEVFQFDSHQLEKWGPQGEIAPISELMDDIVKPTFLASGKEPRAFKSQEWQQAKRMVEKFLHNSGCVGLAPVPYKRVVDDMRARDTLESNSGWPLFTRRNKPEVVAQSIREAENGLWKTYPAIALFRNYNRKTRLVWMFPMSANLVEGSFFQPLQSLLMNTGYQPTATFLSPWKGFEQVREQITYAYGKKSGLYLYASDFSSTDAHFQLSTSMEVCDVLETCFQPRYREALRESISYMHTIPLVTGPDGMITGEHGVSSGSNWTNFIETIFDWILAHYVDLCTEGEMFGFYAIGDDMTWCNAKFSPEFPEAISNFGELVGQEINADKVSCDSDKVVSLQRLFQRGWFRPDREIRAVYPTIRALKSLVYPERFHKPELWSKDMEAIRNYMILENCVDHPLFTELCRFVADGDPNMIRFAKMSSRHQEQLFGQSKLIPGLNPTYNQEKRNSSISQFTSVNLVRTIL